MVGYATRKGCDYPSTLCPVLRACPSLLLEISIANESLKILCSLGPPH